MKANNNIAGTPPKEQVLAKPDSLAFQMYLKQKKRKKRNQAEE